MMGAMTANSLLGMQVDVNTARLIGTDLKLNLPNAMRSAGYRTGASGKWHLREVQNYFDTFPTNWPEYSRMQQIVRDAGFDWADGIYDHTIDLNMPFSHNMEWVTSRAKVRNRASLCI